MRARTRPPTTLENADFAALSLMCQSFVVELLLKFFIATDGSNAKTIDRLKRAGCKLKCHNTLSLSLKEMTHSSIGCMSMRPLDIRTLTEWPSIWSQMCWEAPLKLSEEMLQTPGLE